MFRWLELTDSNNIVIDIVSLSLQLWCGLCHSFIFRKIFKNTSLLLSLSSLVWTSLGNLFYFMLTLKASNIKVQRISRAQGHGFTLREQNAQKHPPSSHTGIVQCDYTPPHVHFTYQPPFLSLSPEWLYFSSDPLSL